MFRTWNSLVDADEQQYMAQSQAVILVRFPKVFTAHARANPKLQITILDDLSYSTSLKNV